MTTLRLFVDPEREIEHRPLYMPPNLLLMMRDERDALRIGLDLIGGLILAQNLLAWSTAESLRLSSLLPAVSINQGRGTQLSHVTSALSSTVLDGITENEWT